MPGGQVTMTTLDPRINKSMTVHQHDIGTASRIGGGSQHKLYLHRSLGGTSLRSPLPCFDPFPISP
jgi:hypothetical protein